MSCIYSVFVGKYENTNLSKSDLKKLNELGLKGYLFSRGDYYALKVFSTINKQQALNIKYQLEVKKFYVEIEENFIKKP